MALSAKDKQGVGLLAAVVVVVIAIFIAKLAFGDKPKPGPDGCVGPVAANTVIVLDHSETLTDQTRTEIVARALAHVQAKAQTNERVTVFNVSDLSRKSLVPTFSRCKPQQDGNRMVEDTKGMAKAYRRDFLEPLTKALNVAPSNAKESPIAQALIDVSLTQYLRGQHNTLLVYSDLLEHMPPKFSLYSCSDAGRTIALFRESRRGAQERPKFINTSVYLNVIPRMNVSKASLKCRDQLWPWFFGDNEGAGAKADVDYLPGA